MRTGRPETFEAGDLGGLAAALVGQRARPGSLPQLGPLVVCPGTGGNVGRQGESTWPL